MRASTLAGAAVAALLIASPLAAQVTVGQVDTFEDGTTQGWQVRLLPFQPPHPAPPANVATGGPAGADDNFLMLTSIGGSGGGSPEPGSRMAVINFAGQWAGNYTAAGITHIRLDASNFGSSELLLRLVLENPPVDFSGPPCDFGVSAAPIALAPGSGWTSLLFPLYGPGGLVHVAGPCPGVGLDGLLANTTAIRLIHNPVVAPNGAPIVAQLGVDNVTAVAVVPEPATLLLVATGLVALPFVARRRRRPA